MTCQTPSSGLMREKKAARQQGKPGTTYKVIQAEPKYKTFEVSYYFATLCVFSVIPQAHIHLHHIF